jgi:cytochrome b
MKIFNASAAKTRILVWDVPVPVFHWLLALSFVGGLCDRRN